MGQVDRRLKEVTMGQQRKGKCACPGGEGVLMYLLTELRLDFQDKISLTSKASSRSLMC